MVLTLKICKTVATASLVFAGLLLWGAQAMSQSVSITDPRLISPTPLTPVERQYAEVAWSYFQQNTDPETGLAPSVRNFKSTTLWDQGGYFMAIVSAYRLELIPREEASARIAKAVNSMRSLQLYQGKAPNKAYDIRSLRMTDYANKPVENGIGWSALDIMRLVSGLVISLRHFPEHAPAVSQLLDLWDISDLISDGRFQGIAVRGKVHSGLVQEGRIGYEQYAAVVGLKIGLPVEEAANYRKILRLQNYFGIMLPGDARTKATHGITAITTSEPFLLEALEYGWRPDALAVATAVYAAQEFRYHKTGILTSLTEDHIAGKPYFAYHAVLAGNEPFVSVTASRQDANHKRAMSTKASFGWWALIRSPYTELLMQHIHPLQTEHGWMAGRFEKDGSENTILSLNTNAVILEALHYKARGPLFENDT